MIEVIIIIVASLPIVWVSRRSLIRPSSHGFARFFAFEAIVALVVINLRHWFTPSLAIAQLLSWALLVASLVLLVWGLHLLSTAERVENHDRDSTLYAWEHTSQLVTSGIFRYVRHPMYASLLYLAWGAALKSITPLTLTLAVVASVALMATARLEEKENVERFGEPDRSYMKRSRRFIPFIY